MLKPATCLFMLCTALTLPVIPAFADDCPSAIAAAVTRAYPGSTPGTCVYDGTEGPRWTLKSATADGRKLEIAVSSEGRILQAVEGIMLASVPHEVLLGLAAREPGAAVAYADKITRGDGRVVYRVTLSTGKTKKAEVFDETWKTLGVE